MGWAPALDLKALTVLYIKEEPNKVQKLLRDSTFPIPLISAISYRVMLTLAGHWRGGFLAHIRVCGHLRFSRAAVWAVWLWPSAAGFYLGHNKSWIMNCSGHVRTRSVLSVARVSALPTWELKGTINKNPRAFQGVLSYWSELICLSSGFNYL